MHASLACLVAFFLGAVLPARAAVQNTMMVVDGRLNDPVWRQFPAEAFTPSQPGVLAEMGGEVRATIVGRYLYVAARLPEPGGRVTARLIGRNPVWEDEDLLRVVAGPDIGFTDRVVTINPLGAYSVERNGQFVHPDADKYLVASSIGEKEWTVELAFPLNLVSAPGPEHILMSVERIRAARPGCPQLRWHWPRQGPVAKVPIASDNWNLPAPEFRPAPPGGEKPALEAGHIGELPPLETGWEDAPWSEVPAWDLLRDEPGRRAPRFPTQVKLLHDGRTLAVLAKCVEPAGILAGTKGPRGLPGPEDSFRVYLATSGSAYAVLSINPLGIRHDAKGVTGGPLVSRAREWESGASHLVRETADGWLVRLSIPLESVAAVLGEARVPTDWRILLLRSRPARDGEPLETSVLPVIESDTPLCPARYQPLRLTDRQIAQGAAPETPPPAFETRVLSSVQRRQMDLAGMLDRHIRERVRKIVSQEEQAWSKVVTRKDWESFRDPRIQALAASFGKFPERTPLAIRVTKDFRGDRYHRQDLVYSSRPGLWVTANLYLPVERVPKMPGFVIVHSHHRPRTQAELQDMGILWARAGCAVLIMDQIGHGERIVTSPWNRDPYHARYMTGMQMYLAGESLLKWMVWDIMRGIDLLLERQDIDPRQIILLGSVAAGGEPAAVTAALDPRVAAVAPFNFNDVNPGWGEWESTRCLRRSIADQFFPWLIGASVAPRRYIYSKEMGWESYRRHTGWERLQKVFALYGVPDHLEETHGFGTFPGPGECSNIGPTQRHNMYPELNRWFGIPTPGKEPDDRRPEAELASQTPAVAADLHMRPIHELAGEVASAKLRAARAELARLAEPVRRHWLRDHWAVKLGGIRPNPRPEVLPRWKKTWKNAAVEGITLDVEPGIVVPLLLLRPAGAGDRRLPVVVAVSQGGKERVMEASGEIEGLLEGGVALCLPDVRGTGETLPDPRRGLSGEEDSRAATEFMLGNTLLGARLKDLRTVIAWLRSRSDLDARQLAIWGDTYALANPARLLLDETPGWQIGPVTQRQSEPLGGLLALLAALYEDDVRAVAVKGGLASYVSVLADNYAYLPNDVIVPGILEVGDLGDVAAALGLRPLLLEGLVDGRNQLVPEPELRREFPGAVIGARSLSEWLLAQLRMVER